MRYLLYPLLAAAMMASAQAVSADELEMSPTEKALTAIYTEDRCFGATYSTGDWVRFLETMRTGMSQAPTLSQMVSVKRRVGNRAGIGWCFSDAAMTSHEYFQSTFGT